jgi:hypothetical protein
MCWPDVVLQAILGGAAQPAHAPDAAARRQDRGDFGIAMRSNGIPIYRCGAGEAQTVSPPQSNPNMRGRYHPSPTVGLMAHYAIRRERIVLL